MYLNIYYITIYDILHMLLHNITVYNILYINCKYDMNNIII